VLASTLQGGKASLIEFRNSVVIDKANQLRGSPGNFVLKALVMQKHWVLFK
jgi:hypothetical protein